MKVELEKKEKVYADYEEKRTDTPTVCEIELDSKVNIMKVTAGQLEKTSVSLEGLIDKTESLNQELEKLEGELASLAELLDQNPEEQRQQALTSIHELSIKTRELQCRESTITYNA